MRRPWLVLALVAGCGSRRPVDATPEPPPLDAAARPTTIDAAARVAGDPPEPTAPAAECAFDRSVFCEDGVPTRTALQPAPFEWCHPTRPARQQSLYRTDARFSAAETRAARATAPDACCYVEFSTMACV